MPYFLIILLLCFIIFYEFLDIKPDGFLIKKNSITYFYLMCAVLLWLIAVLRFETGRGIQNFLNDVTGWR